MELLVKLCNYTRASEKRGKKGRGQERPEINSRFNEFEIF